MVQGSPSKTKIESVFKKFMYFFFSVYNIQSSFYKKISYQIFFNQILIGNWWWWYDTEVTLPNIFRAITKV